MESLLPSSATPTSQGNGRALRHFVVPAASAALLFGACKIDARTPTLAYQPSSFLTEVDEEGEPYVPAAMQANIHGSLAMLFGQPTEPRYMLLEDWADDGWNPNWPQYPEGDDGMGDIDDDTLDAIYADNERSFASQLAAIDAAAEGSGPWAAVTVPETAPDLADAWADMLAQTEEEGFAADAEFVDDAKYLFANWYPKLKDSAELYRVQCMHCHGVSGEGDGTTAPYLNPKPRNYTLGVFKFTALKDKARPRRADIVRILDEGVTGTAMPSFRRLSLAELHGLADYVRLLSIRGETERYIVTLAEDEDFSYLTTSMVNEAYEEIWSRWTGQEDKVISFDGEVPPVTEEMLARGRELFGDATRGNCVSCHGDNGGGTGPSAYEEVDGELVFLKDDWGDELQPRNLVHGVFRGGRRPIDVYRRIYAGINGSYMPGIGDVTEADDPVMTKDDLWALVHYVRSLSERPAHHPVAHADGAAGAGH